MTFLPILPSVNENLERESNPMPWPLFLCLSGSAFLVSLTDQNKQLSNVKYLFNFLNHGVSVLEIYRFITFLGIGMLFFIKQCQLKLCLVINNNQQKLVQKCCLI